MYKLALIDFGEAGSTFAAAGRWVGAQRYVDASPISAEKRQVIFEGDARRVFPRLDGRLQERGL